MPWEWKRKCPTWTSLFFRFPCEISVWFISQWTSFSKNIYSRNILLGRFCRDSAILNHLKIIFFWSFGKTVGGRDLFITPQTKASINTPNSMSVCYIMLPTTFSQNQENQMIMGNYLFTFLTIRYGRVCSIWDIPHGKCSGSLHFDLQSQVK